jgi:hypothetical protein
VAQHGDDPEGEDRDGGAGGDDRHGQAGAVGDGDDDRAGGGRDGVEVGFDPDQRRVSRAVMSRSTPPPTAVVTPSRTACTGPR